MTNTFFSSDIAQNQRILWEQINYIDGRYYSLDVKKRNLLSTKGQGMLRGKNILINKISFLRMQIGREGIGLNYGEMGWVRCIDHQFINANASFM
jgi:hypothetical protein